MGLVFNRTFVFIVVPLTGMLCIPWLLTRRKIVRDLLCFTWLGVLALVLIAVLVRWKTAKTNLEKADYIGEYVVHRSHYPGAREEWQFEHFPFTISENDSICFYAIDKGRIREKYTRTISTTLGNTSKRLRLAMYQPTHHILASNPTTYRSAWSIYLVFHSPNINNVFFRKAH